MMHVYVVPGERQGWVAAVFERESDALAWRERVPSAIRDSMSCSRRSDLAYPFVIVESLGRPNSFEFVSPAQAEKKLSELRRSGQEPSDDGTYCNVYLLREDYLGHPDRVGNDYMGILSHWHVDDAWLDSAIVHDEWPWRENDDR